MRRTLALSFVLLAAAATNAFAGAEARLTGKIVDAATKKPVPNATILVTSADAAKNFKQEYKAKTDGTYSIFVLDGTIRYQFAYSAPGYAPYTDVMKLNIGGAVNTKDVELASAAAAEAKAVTSSADPAIVAYNEGANLANEGKIPEAIAKIEEACKLKPEFPAAYQALAKLYLRSKDYDKAIERATKALAADAEDEEMNAVMYEALTAKGDKTKAAEYKAKMPASPTALFNDAAKLINAGKDKDAEPLLKQAVTIDEKFAQAYYELGMLQVRTGKNAEAKVNLQKYIDLDPNGKEVATAKEMLKYVK